MFGTQTSCNLPAASVVASLINHDGFRFVVLGNPWDSGNGVGDFFAQKVMQIPNLETVFESELIWNFLYQARFRRIPCLRKFCHFAVISSMLLERERTHAKFSFVGVGTQNQEQGLFGDDFDTANSSTRCNLVKHSFIHLLFIEKKWKIITNGWQSFIRQVWTNIYYWNFFGCFHGLKSKFLHNSVFNFNFNFFLLIFKMLFLTKNIWFVLEEFDFVGQ